VAKGALLGCPRQWGGATVWRVFRSRYGAHSAPKGAAFARLLASDRGAPGTITRLFAAPVSGLSPGPLGVPTAKAAG